MPVETGASWWEHWPIISFIGSSILAFGAFVAGHRRLTSDVGKIEKNMVNHGEKILHLEKTMIVEQHLYNSDKSLIYQTHSGCVVMHNHLVETVSGDVQKIEKMVEKVESKQDKLEEAVYLHIGKVNTLLEVYRDFAKDK